MLHRAHWIAIACCFVGAAAASCGGGSPAGPSPAAGATIAGTVFVNGGGATLPNAAASGLTVSIDGTSLSASVESSGYFQINGAPSGDLRLHFKAPMVDATAEIRNVGPEELVEIEVQVDGSTATILEEARSTTKVSICHRTDSGAYHLITVSEHAEPAHRAHGDGKIGEKVPGSDTQVFDESCKPAGPAVEIKKYTNGVDADTAPGPKLLIGSTVTWDYTVTNRGTVPLTGISVVDDRGVTVNCPKNALAPGESMTCTGSGIAVAGQYKNIGTVDAASASGSVSDTDASHYFGRAEDDENDGPKVQLCHKTGNGSYHLIEVSVNAEPAHRAHGDGKVGEPVPGNPGKVFGPGCSIN